MTRERLRRGQRRPPGREAPNTTTWLFRLVRLLVVLKIALVVYSFDPVALDSFALTKSVVSHVTALLLAAVLAVVLASDPSSFRPTWIHLAMGALLVAFIGATAFAVDQTIGAFGSWRRYLGLDQMVDNTALFLGVATAFRSRKDRGAMAFGLLAIAAPVCAYGVLQWSGRDFVHYVEAPGTRPIGTFGQPDTAGAFFAIVAAAGAAYAVWPWSKERLPMRVAASALVIVALLLCLATGVKASLLAVGAGVLALAAVLLIARVRLRLDARRAVALAAGGALVAGVAFAIAAVASAPVFGASGEARLEIWQTAVRAWFMRPLLGVGPDNFAAVYPALHDIRSIIFSSQELQTSTHNIALYVATSAGSLGFGAWLALLVLTAARALRAAGDRDSDALVLVLLSAYVGQGLVTITDLGLEWIPFVAAGLMAASADPVFEAKVRSPVRSATALGAVAIVALLVAAGLGQAQVSRLTASEALANAEALRVAKRPLVAVDYTRQALQIDNSRAEHWGFFGSDLQDAGNPSAARSAFMEAAQRDPWNPLYWRDVALTFLAQGDELHARGYLERTLAADPYDAQAHDLLARLAFNAGDWQRALDNGAMAVQLVPTNADAYEAPVRAAIKLERWQQAEQLLRQAIAGRDLAHFHVLLALVYADSGRTADALAQLDRALSISPGDAEALKLRQQIAP